MVIDPVVVCGTPRRMLGILSDSRCLHHDLAAIAAVDGERNVGGGVNRGIHRGGCVWPDHGGHTGAERTAGLELHFEVAIGEPLIHLAKVGGLDVEAVTDDGKRLTQPH